MNRRGFGVLDSTRYRRVLDIAREVVEESGNRDQRIRELCGDDHGLRRAVCELLDQAETINRTPDYADTDTITFGNSQTARITADSSQGNFGGYEILEEISRGGMGVVYRARQIAVNRVVALKVIKEGRFEDDDALERFRTEAEAAARLDHPGIVPVYESGQQDGKPFLSMAFVDGLSLADRIREAPLPAQDAARVIGAVAEAVQHAHDQGVLHRDLKPQNILLDSEGNPRVTDFGLAKKLFDDTQLTKTGEIMGTPAFMSPEQAAGRATGKATDIYSLGATLYAVMTGRPPFQAGSSIETMQQVIDREPISPRHLNPAVDRDLETICLKCLEKNPEKRYASAVEVADDLQRYLAHEPIVARPIGRVDRLLRWCRRNPLATAAIGLLLAFLVSVAFGWIRTERALTDREQALTEKDEAWKAEKSARQVAEMRSRQLRGQSLSAQAITAFDSDPQLALLLSAEALRISANNSAGDDSTLQKILQKILVRNVSQLITRTPTSRSSLRSKGTSYGGMGYFFSRDSKWLTGIAGSRPRRVTFWNLATFETDVTPSVPPDFHGTIQDFIVSGDSKWAAVRFEDNHVRLIGLTAQGGPANRRQFDLPVNSATSITFSRDSRYLATGDATGAVRLWDTRRQNPAVDPIVAKPPKERTPLRTIDKSSQVARDIHFSPRQAVMAVVTKHTVRFWAIANDRARALSRVTTGDSIPRYVLPGRESSPFADYSPRGRWMIARSSMTRRGSLLIGFDDTGKPRHAARLGSISGADFSPDDNWIAARSTRNTILIWSLHKDRPSQKPFEISSRSRGFAALAFTADGRNLLTAEADGTILNWRLQRNAQPKSTQFAEEIGKVRSLQVSPDGKHLAVGLEDKSVRLWKLDDGKPTGKPRLLKLKTATARVMTPPSYAFLRTFDLKFNADGTRLAAVVEGRDIGVASGIHLWHLADGKSESTSLPSGPASTGAFRFSENGTQLVVHSSAAAGVWSLVDFSQPALVVRSGSPKCNAVNANRTRVAVGRADGSISLFDLTHPQPIDTPLILRGHKGAVVSLMFDAGGRRLFSLDDLGELRQWDVTGKSADHLPTKQVKGAQRIRAVLPGSRVLVERSIQTVKKVERRGETMVRHMGPVVRRCTLVDFKGLVKKAPLIQVELRNVTASADGTRIAVATDTALEVWRTTDATMNRTKLIDLNKQSVKQIFFLAGARVLVAATSPKVDRFRRIRKSPNPAERTGMLRVWRFSGNGKPMLLLNRRFPSNFGVAGSRNGRRLVVASTVEAEILLYDLTHANPARSAKTLAGHRDGVTHLALTEDGSFLASLGRDKLIRLTDLRSGTPDNGIIIRRNVTLGRGGSVSTPHDRTPELVFSPDGRRLFTFPSNYGSPQATRVLTGNDSTRDLIKLARQLAGRSLTPAERRKFGIDDDAD